MLQTEHLELCLISCQTHTGNTCLGEVIFRKKNDINPSVLENGVMVVTLKGNINKHRNPKLLWSIHFLKLTKIAYPNVIMSVLLVLNNKRASS